MTFRERVGAFREARGLERYAPKALAGSKSWEKV